jgi:hypothetical protein
VGIRARGQGERARRARGQVSLPLPPGSAQGSDRRADRGEVEVGKTLLRNYVIARLGFDELGRLTGKAPQSLTRMLSRTGNPQARNLFEVIRVLQEHEGVQTEMWHGKSGDTTLLVGLPTAVAVESPLRHICARTPSRF